MAATGLGGSRRVQGRWLGLGEEGEEPLGGLIGGFGVGEGEELDLGEGAEPGELALGELAGAGLDEVDGGGLGGEPAGEEVEDLAVADALHGDGVGRVRLGEQAADLVDQAVGEHG